jgi:hypothetical protein
MTCLLPNNFPDTEQHNLNNRGYGKTTALLIFNSPAFKSAEQMEYLSVFRLRYNILFLLSINKNN